MRWTTKDKNIDLDMVKKTLPGLNIWIHTHGRVLEDVEWFEYTLRMTDPGVFMADVQVKYVDDEQIFLGIMHNDFLYNATPKEYQRATKPDQREYNLDE